MLIEFCYAHFLKRTIYSDINVLLHFSISFVIHHRIRSALLTVPIYFVCSNDSHGSTASGYLSVINLCGDEILVTSWGAIFSRRSQSLTGPSLCTS